MSIHDITHLLSRIDQDPKASDELLPLVYTELRRLARAKMARQTPGQTLQTTALVHEAYLRLVRQEVPQNWQGRGHFFAAAAEAMRRILVEQARRKRSQKHGGDLQRVNLDVESIPREFDLHEADRILAIHEALTEFAVHSPREAKLVELRFFAGMTLAEAAAAMNISLSAAKRDWAAARVWMFRRLSKDH